MDVPSIPREQSHVEFLHESMSDLSLDEEEARLEDYVNDKIQTRADLASLATLMEKVELQKKQLDDQVSHHYSSSNYNE